MNYLRLFMTLLTIGCVDSTSRGQLSPSAIDPHLVVGYEKCSKCHQAEIDVWKKTPHYQTFEQLHRTPEAKQIASRLGLKSIKRNDVCMQCHYTQQHANGKIKPTAGVSCESCHGGAKEWLDVHNDYGGADVTREQESLQHQRKRRELAMSRGMRNPVNLYLVAQSCLGCHTAPSEQLVNVGGHSAGSIEFELVQWSQGMVRHNFSRSLGKRNDISSPDRLRVMYLVGLMTDLEYSLRATGKATTKANYGITNARRVDRIRKRLRSLQPELNNRFVQRAIDAAYQAKLTINNGANLNAAADLVGQTAFEFAETEDGSTLSALDRLMPPASSFK